jgi:DNA polymerase-1
VVVPPIEELQRDPVHRKNFIDYSTYDAEGTWKLREELEKRLKTKSWFQNKNLYDYYWMHMRPFGEVLTDMERRGIRVDAKDYLAKVELKARKERAEHERIFQEWAATKIGPDGLALNVASSVQMQTFLFGGAENIKTKELTERVRVFKVPREEIPERALEAYRLRDQAAKGVSKGTCC